MNEQMHVNVTEGKMQILQWQHLKVGIDKEHHKEPLTQSF